MWKRIAVTVFWTVSSFAGVRIGTGHADLTPPESVPLAGYFERQGKPSEGVHDPLSATALFIDNGVRRIVLCGVDHLGFSYEMVQEVRSLLQKREFPSDCEIYIAASHTHSGGGAFLDIPGLGEVLAGKYDSKVKAFYIERTVEAIVAAYVDAAPGKIGIGYAKTDPPVRFRGDLSEIPSLPDEIFVIYATDPKGNPKALFFHYPMHPTILRADNRKFSADFVGYARSWIRRLVGADIAVIYANGAQGDLVPKVEDGSFATCEQTGKSLALSIETLRKTIIPTDFITIANKKNSYSFSPEPTPFGTVLPISSYATEMNALVFNERHVLLTIPGELSYVYAEKLRDRAGKAGYETCSVLGLVNDAHGYILTPSAFRNKAYEASFSFGGELYGERTLERGIFLLEALAPSSRLLEERGTGTE